MAPALKKRIDISKLGGRLRPTGALADELRFLKTLIGSPKLTGAVSPSGRFLARAMAKAVGPVGDGLVVELGPGTGPVTRALIAQGVDQEQLVLVEFETEFCRLLRQRFPGARVVQGDAFALRRTLAELADRPIRAVVSSLPLLNQPSARRAALVEDAFALMAPGGVFVQFSYGVASPIRRPADAGRFSAHGSAPIWANLPPARVWTYRAEAGFAAPAPLLARLCERADRLGEEWSRRAGDMLGARRAGLEASVRARASKMLGKARRR